MNASTEGGRQGSGEEIRGEEREANRADVVRGEARNRSARAAVHGSDGRTDL